MEFKPAKLLVEVVVGLVILITLLAILGKFLP